MNGKTPTRNANSAFQNPFVTAFFVTAFFVTAFLVTAFLVTAFLVPAGGRRAMLRHPREGGDPATL